MPFFEDEGWPSTSVGHCWRNQAAIAAKREMWVAARADVRRMGTNLSHTARGECGQSSPTGWMDSVGPDFPSAIVMYSWPRRLSSARVTGRSP
jgi:hypothetical protein